MNIEFLTNDYLLAWYLLFKPSFSEEVQQLKVKLYHNYGKQYNRMEKENIEILKHTNDFIPDDDTIYNLVFESEIFKKIKKETDHHRQFLMKIWDTNNKKIKEYLKEILRFEVNNIYHIIVIHPQLDTIEYIQNSSDKNIVWGTSVDKEDNIKTLMRIVYTVIKYELGSFHKDNRELVSSIIDLAITNELQTRMSGVSKYKEGFKNLKPIKNQIYPYFLMYLGADREELVSYMMRDKIVFDIDKYPIEKELQDINLVDFIDYCCNKQKDMIIINNLDKI